MAEKKEEKQDEKVNAVTVSSEKLQLIFALKGEAVYITVRKKGQKPDNLVVTAHDWMQINKGMFNPEDKSPVPVEEKKKSRKTKAKKEEPAN